MPDVIVIQLVQTRVLLAQSQVKKPFFKANSFKNLN